MTASRGYEANTCFPSKRTLWSIHRYTLFPNGPWMCLLGVVFNGYIYCFLDRSKNFPRPFLYIDILGIYAWFYFFASQYFSVFSTLTVQSNGEQDDPPPPILEKFPNNHADQDQGGSMSRNTFNNWSAVRTKQPTVWRLGEVFWRKFEIISRLGFSSRITALSLFPKAPSTLASPLYQMQR